MNVNYETYDREDAILVLNPDTFNINSYQRNDWKRLVREQTLGYNNFNDLLLSSTTDTLTFHWYGFDNKAFYEVKLPLQELRKSVEGAMTKAYLDGVFSFAMQPYYKGPLANYTALLDFKLLPDGYLKLTMEYGATDANLLELKAKEVSWYTTNAHSTIETFDEWKKLVFGKYNWRLEISDPSIKSRDIRTHFYKPSTSYRYSPDISQEKEMPAPLCFQFTDEEKQTINEIKIGEEILTILDNLPFPTIVFIPPVIAADYGVDTIEEEEIEESEEIEETVDAENIEEEPIVLSLILGDDPQHTRLVAKKAGQEQEVPIRHLIISSK